MMNRETVAVLGCAAALTCAAAQQTTVERVLHLPKDRPVGRLFLRGAGAALKEWDGWQPHGPAQGAIAVPESKERRLDVSDEAYENLPALAALRADDLHFLYVSSPELADADLQHLRGLTGLRSLTLHGGPHPHVCPLTGTGLIHLKDMKSLRDLTILSSELDDKGLAHVAHLAGLENLSLLHNGQVHGEGLAYLRALRSLKSLSFYRVPVTDVGLENLKGMSQLESLGLQYTEVTDGGLACLSGLRSLKSLALPSATTDAGLVHIGKLPALQLLSLDEGCPRDPCGLANPSPHPPRSSDTLCRIWRLSGSICHRRISAARGSWCASGT